MSWLLSADGWTHYDNADLADDFTLTQESADVEAVRNAYLTINRAVVADCPMISAYIISTLGAVSDRLVGCTPDVYGTFLNVHEWDVQ